jgi:hypothetical protein
MNGFGKALMGMIHVLVDRLMARKIPSGVTMLALAGIVLLMVAEGASAATAITNCTDLQEIKDNLSGDYYLANDIDCSCTKTWNEGAGFEPIGNSSNLFTGTFDGWGHHITNLYINRSPAWYVGLFGHTGSGSEIKNVSLEEVDVSGSCAVGGLVGYNKETIINSYSTGSVNASMDYAGGLVGYNLGTVSNSYSTCNVSGEYDPGGLVGYNYYGTITNSYSTGNVSGEYNPGGLVGYNLGMVNNSYWDMNTSGQDWSEGGEGKTTTQMKQQATFENWDFANVWAIEEDVSYPFFRWAGCGCGCIGVVTGNVYQCGDTVTESCTLNWNMSCPNMVDGLIIGANDIVIDGAGYKITGNESNCLCYNGGMTDEQVTAPHCGIRNNGNYDNVVIKNLEIENFCTGIALGDVAHISVDNNTVTGCYIHHNGNDTECGVSGDVVTHGIHMVAANNCTITKNEIAHNDGTGDQCGGGGNGIFMFWKKQ